MCSAQGPPGGRIGPGAPHNQPGPIAGAGRWVGAEPLVRLQQLACGQQLPGAAANRSLGGTLTHCMSTAVSCVRWGTAGAMLCVGVA